jgi:diphosphomevalonate decarboxylase
MPWLAKAPANIALIKYMGKKEQTENVPINASLSYTLNKLLSLVSLELIDQDDDDWQPLDNSDAFKDQVTSPTLSEQGKVRFINHLKKMKSLYQFEGSFLIRSANTFPMDAGLASSASSFAALTIAANKALSELTGNNLLESNEQLARFSQTGSGSSCRSFFSPFALWQENSISAMDFPQVLESMVVVACDEKKAVSSSLAHQRIQSSPRYGERATTANQHLQMLIKALEENDWERAFNITWKEFMDMHQLFHTACPPFSYINQHSEAILALCQRFGRIKRMGL